MLDVFDTWHFTFHISHFIFSILWVLTFDTFEILDIRHLTLWRFGHFWNVAFVVCVILDIWRVCVCCLLIVDFVFAFGFPFWSGDDLTCPGQRPNEFGIWFLLFVNFFVFFHRHMLWLALDRGPVDLSRCLKYLRVCATNSHDLQLELIFPKDGRISNDAMADVYAWGCPNLLLMWNIIANLGNVSTSTWMFIILDFIVFPICSFESVCCGMCLPVFCLGPCRPSWTLLKMLPRHGVELQVHLLSPGARAFELCLSLHRSIPSLGFEHGGYLLIVWFLWFYQDWRPVKT